MFPVENETGRALRPPPARNHRSSPRKEPNLSPSSTCNDRLGYPEDRLHIFMNATQVALTPKDVVARFLAAGATASLYRRAC
jgi:hypothetical protein